MLLSPLSLLPVALVLIGGSYFLLRLFQSFTSPLRDIPGPFWTRFSKLWYLKHVKQGHFEKENIQLHKQYGPVVRLGPNLYSISDAAAVKTVYGTGSKFPKSDWYESWRQPGPNHWTLFSDTNIRGHADARKRFSAIYSMSSLVNYEQFVDNCADIFAMRLTEFAAKDEVLDLRHWLQCYAFDVIGEITYGERFGFLDGGRDIAGVMKTIDGVNVYATLVGIYSSWHPFIFSLLRHFSGSGADGRTYMANFVREKLREHDQKLAKAKEIGPDGSLKVQDFIEKMMIARDKDPNKVNDYHIFTMGQSNVNAGSDTTSISLSSIMYHLLKFPDTFRKLRQEIDDFTTKGLYSGKVTFKESQDMPYLQAVIKEALRIHSATGLPLWRVVPAGGARISGHYFPAGTVVGVNTWVAHYDERVFPDPTAFRPERWIEAENDPAKLKVMNDMYMPFGLGSRTCIGRHISILEMSKLIPRLVRDFDFSFAGGSDTWHTHNSWFVKQSGFDVKVQKRVDIA